MSNWIKITDKLPEEGQEVWAYFQETGISKMTYHNLRGTKDEAFGRNFFIGDGGFLTDDVTQWQADKGQSLPDSPGDEKGGDAHDIATESYRSD